MAGSPPQTQPAAEDAHLVLYDGVCGFCSRLVQFLLTHDRRGLFTFAPLQSATGRAVIQRFGGDPGELTSFYVLANYRMVHARLFGRSAAALFVAGELGWPWKAAAVLRVLPAATLDHVYDAIARNRYRVFGRHEQCVMPRPEFRGRFVE
jgi:predicted DCC family thiol-disulfide oxidoreductase YuxK